MSDQPLTELDPRIRKQVEKARNSVKTGSAAFAIEICMGLVEKYPGCVEAREVLHSAHRAAKSGKKKSFLSGLTSKPLSKIGGVTLKKDPAKAMIQAEKILKDDPDSVDALRLLGDGAALKDLPHTAVFAYEGAYEKDTSNLDVAKKLADLYLKVDRPNDCIRVCERIIREHPGDGEAQDIVKRASVAQSMEKGKWEEEGDFRSKLKNKAEAENLEQASRSTTTEENLEKLIQDTYEKIQAEPENLTNYKQISTYYHRAGDYESAISWVQEARKLEGGKADVSLERLETKLYREYVDSLIQAKKAELEADPENQELQQELEGMVEERKKYLIEHSADMVKRYPNDYAARHQYGELLLEDGQIDLAIQQLQIALRNPKVRIPSLNLLGQAYKAKEFYDLAAEQFETAKGEINGMSEIKKDVIYNLAECYEKMGETEKAIDRYKEIYSADIGFRDVSKKIDEFYANRNKG
ncbi:tetratricopeptide repeat protein [Puniceicoccus vermicola]|uniref:Tetratricopeptide repeat protein n=1 Tax=Puniceicoccus vermicola TaxID=388746 RepID=A0A7X1E426_9BACT|nr:tetratricopeptide repeat protein [Puniceicoccus vermicola]MBC2601686.1 tetratricopeptide repeat protein [Puniceicoccus vermicola]